MDKDNGKGPLMPHGGYRKLRSYKVAEAVYDATVVFCRRFHKNDRRMTDQLVQAARSGVRNISEGSGAAATSRKTEMHLTNVARASLADELLEDYRAFLLQNGMRIWPADSREAQAMRERLRHDHVEGLNDGKVRLTGLLGLSDFVMYAEPELAANAMICAINQAVYLLNRQLKSQVETFTAEGGFTENLYAARTKHRNNPATETSVLCPSCGKDMVQRKARTGKNAGNLFWGCVRYPECKGIRPITTGKTSDTSDRSDTSD